MFMHDTAIKPTLTVQEAAAALGVDQSTVIRRLQRGDLRGKKVGKSWKIPADQVDRRVTEKRDALSEWAAKSSQADALTEAARAGYWPALADIRTLCGRVVDMSGDLDGLIGSDPVVQRERLESFEALLGELRRALDRRVFYRDVYELAGQVAADAAARGREAGDQFNADQERRRDLAQSR
jgi:excisionase family DNA binding protein